MNPVALVSIDGNWTLNRGSVSVLLSPSERQKKASEAAVSCDRDADREREGEPKPKKLPASQ